ncbi:MaoC family dehydratase [Lentzea sp. NPDC042327]|uniref:MaoC family dehydratase n=1 Tax=Lentzea sp. NPDC042327 TaxID=3154801 RepID=UPI003409B355
MTTAPTPAPHTAAGDIAQPTGYRRIGPGRFRENVGLGYDELTVGLVIEHRPGRTVTDTDNLLGTMLTGNVAPIHTDAHYAAQTRHGRIVVCASVTLGLVAGMTVRSTSGLTTANLGLDNARFPHPVYVGDTLHAESEVLTRRHSASRPGEGLLTCAVRALNQHDELVLQFERTFLVPLDPTAVRNVHNY